VLSVHQSNERHTSTRVSQPKSPTLGATMPLSPEFQAEADKEIEETIQTERDAAKEGGYSLPAAAEKAIRELPQQHNRQIPIDHGGACQGGGGDSVGSPGQPWPAVVLRHSVQLAHASAWHHVLALLPSPFGIPSLRDSFLTTANS
jgi:hypothetical protein